MKSIGLHEHIKNRIIFYCNYIDEQKKGVLEKMNVQVRLIDLRDVDNDYFKYYKELIKMLKRDF